jgi:Zn-dependent protease with chaperone function
VNQAPSPADAPNSAAGRVTVSPWPSEQPLFALVVLVSLMLWMSILFSIFGAIYAVIIALGLFFVHLLFIVHVRGSGVRLGPKQFPDLDRRVRELALQAGLDEIPATYLMEAGGALNAFATKFLRSRMIVLFSDLLEACGEDRAARDMVIGHELGHIRQRHLNWSILIAPGMFVPFLGAAYSRARELTCDRWGAALCGDRAGALRGLAILAAGGKHGPRVDFESFVAQRQDLDTGWMTVGRWLSTYPTLAERVAALDDELSRRAPAAGRGPLRAAGILALGCLLPVLAGGVLVAFAGAKLKALADATRPNAGLAALQTAPAEDESSFVEDEDAAPLVETLGVEAATRLAEEDLRRIAQLLDAAGTESGDYPEDLDALIALWESSYPGEVLPKDPFDGAAYGYERRAGGYRLWSSGPDGESETADDLRREAKLAGQ